MTKRMLLKRMKRTIKYFCLTLAVIILAGCSNDDFIGVIPANSTALMSIDVARLAESKQGVDARLLRAMFHVATPGDCGIDMANKMYVFQTIDGTMGLVAGVKDEDKVGEWLTQMQQKGICSRQQSQQGKHYATLNNLWVVVYDDHAFLVMGPVLPTAQPTMVRQMAKMLDGESKIRESQIYAHLETIDAPMALVAQARALPDQLMALCTLGAPSNASPDKVLLEATITDNDGCLVVDGEPFSFDADIDAALKKASEVYRPLKNSYLKYVPGDALYTIMANVDGKTFLPLLQDNKQLNAMMAGMSTKVDLEAFMNSIDGDMVFTFQGTEDNIRMKWAADQTKEDSGLDEESLRWLNNNRMDGAQAIEAVQGTTSSKLPESVMKSLEKNRMATIIRLSLLKQMMPLDMFSSAEYVIFTIKNNNE